VSPGFNLVDTTIRDGNQSLWGGTGITTADVLGVAAVADRVGFRALDFTSSTHLGISVRYHREDPWERLRLTSAAMPNTMLTFLTTGTRFISWKPASEDLLELAFRSVTATGVRRFQIMHPSNDVQTLATLARIARIAGAEEVVLGLTYSVSPVHDDTYFAARIDALAQCEDADRLYLKDPGGLLTPGRAATLVARMVGTAAALPVEVHSHCTTSLAPLVYLEALRNGASTVHTAVAPLARGSSQPSAEMTLSNATVAGFDHDIDEQALAEMSLYFTVLAADKGLPTGVMAEYDESYYRHQLPGGMATTMRRQLEEMRRGDLFDAALDEVARVRAELGYPIMVTPLSQFIVTQAVMNVVGGERYATVPDEVIRLMLGQFGDPPAPPDPQVADRVLSQPRAAALRNLEPLSLDGARKRFGRRISDEELLLRITMPEEQVEAMLAQTHVPAPAGAASAPPVSGSPLVVLLRELDRRPALSNVELRQGDEVVQWRRRAGTSHAR
jgi:oxaloacetate decarboxylase alpha subunit